MDMVDVIIGVAAGFAGGYVLTSQTAKSKSVSSTGTPYATLYNEAQAEINMLKSNLRDRDSEIDDLHQKIKTLSKKLRDYEDQADDKSDYMDDMKRTIESLRRQNENLEEKATEYKSLYTAAQQEIERLKG